MTPDETARRLLTDAPGEARCDSCLAFASSVSLAEMRRVTEALLKSPSFSRRQGCLTCGRPVPAIAYVAKCAQCSAALMPGEREVIFGGALFHAACLRVLLSEAAIRMSRDLNQQSRRLIESARRQIQAHRKRRNAESGSEP